MAFDERKKIAREQLQYDSGPSDEESALLAAGWEEDYSYHARIPEQHNMAVAKVNELKSSGQWLVTVANFTLIIGALFDFFTERLWWWLAPALFILAVFVGLVIHTHSAVIAVTPFIYTLF